MSVSALSFGAINGTVAAQNGFASLTPNTVVVTTKPAGPSLSTVKDSAGVVISTASIGPSATASTQNADAASLHITA
jgi:hypothetical protein